MPVKTFDITGPLRGNPLVTGGSSSQMAGDIWGHSCHVTSLQCYQYNTKMHSWYHYCVILTHCGLVTPYAGCHKTWLTLVRAMVCCLTAPRHYPNQWWLIISEVLWHSPARNFRQKSMIWVGFIITTASSRGWSINLNLNSFLRRRPQCLVRYPSNSTQVRSCFSLACPTKTRSMLSRAPPTTVSNPCLHT